ncbi:UvrD-helicase domain-containing protein [Roseateles oligotrophus]|uniref:DNA 3'-5' helicase n=1 Tax=Roseateles oligotrophus TaxID=1769250 RepID=A0ABT2YJ77_9BURK|nr:ATP-dependent helicase [Roseateles oligotrophus]MCV2370109.1 ATP-dependent helicase [Roseateles oligotrophus]
MSAPGSLRFSTQAIAITAEQEDIQASGERAILIEAAAGTAKTTSLALRICEVLARGATPRRMLALTFTPTACLALRRALQLVAGDSLPHKQVRVETFDSYAASVLRQMEAPADGDDSFTPARLLHSAEQARPYVWAAVDAVADNPQERHAEDLSLPSHGAESYVGEFLRRTQSIKGRLLLELNPPEQGSDSPDYANDELGLDYSLLRVLRAYEHLRLESGYEQPNFRMPLDATYDLARLLRSDSIGGPEELPLGQFDGIFVDEMHDCNEAMFTLLKALLIQPKVYFCAVGDRDQVIHQHFGADARFMSRALDAELGRKLQRLPLSLSFRYGPALAGWMAKLAGKPIAAQKLRQTELLAIACEGAGQPKTAAAVVGALQRWRGEQRKDDVYSDCAVLLRRESQSVLLENALHAQGIAYQCMGFGSYLRRPEVLFVRTVYAIASGRLDTLGGADTRRLIPDALFEMTQTPVLKADDPDYQSAEAFLREARAAAADSEQVVAKIFNQHILDWAPAQVRQRLQNALQTVQAGGDFAAFLAALDMARFGRDVFVEKERRDELRRHMQGLLAASLDYAGVLDFFKSLQAQDEAQAQRVAGRAEGKVRSNKSRPTITLASAAHVKGLEFEHVLLPYLAQGVFPDVEAEAAGEKNLFYVAATRARSRLTLLVNAERPSPFVPPALIARLST